MFEGSKTTVLQQKKWNIIGTAMSKIIFYYLGQENFLHTVTVIQKQQFFFIPTCTVKKD